MTVVEWLLDSDPSIRWQVVRDLTDEPAKVVAAERARVAKEGWGARLLALQGADGQWGGGTLFPKMLATTSSLMLLRDFGLDPESEEARRAIALVREHSRWDHAGQPFFEGEVEPCINGRAVTIGVSQRPRSCGSSTSRSPSPRRLKPSTASMIASPGKTLIQGAVSR
jgi:hypothetical protein